ncbi:MAG: GatB/YqeY domain-containing protein, partial [Gammaproteobacteria bacterium]
MKAGEKDRLGTLRLISAAFKQFEVDERAEVDDERAIELLTRMAKQRRESIEQY